MQPLIEKMSLEIPVTLALVDLLRPGDIAFDIGASVGDVSIIMSRLVGPRGCVVSLEANSRTAEIATGNLREYNCFNSLLLNRAATATSNEKMQLYLGNGPNDSLVAWPWLSDQTIPVTTIALDDLITHLQLRPCVIKVDVEGYELHVLKGAHSYLMDERPVLILEQNDGDDSCIRFLSDLGYEIYCLGSYRRIRSPSDYFRFGEAHVRNVVAVHPEERGHLGSAFARPDRIELREVLRLAPSDFIADGPWSRSKLVALPAGRYTLQQRYSTTDLEEIEVGLASAEGRFAGSYHGAPSWLEHLPDLPIHLDEPAELGVALHCRDGLLATGRVQPSEFQLVRVEGVPSFRPGLAYLL